MNIKLITFGSHDNHIDGGNRVLQQAAKLHLFTETILYTGDDLKRDDIFWNAHQTFVEKNKRGYGYWLWKPYLIKKNMEQMCNGDVLLYVDCGCEINYYKKDEFLKSIDSLKEVKIIATKTRTEKDWNKMDLIEKLDMNKDIYLDTPQNQATAIFFLVCDETRRFVNEWYELGCDYHNIDDSPSIIKNLDCFKEHRHDQSIFSLLIKKYNLCNESKYDYSLLSHVYLFRNKSGLSITGL